MRRNGVSAIGLHCHGKHGLQALRNVRRRDPVLGLRVRSQQQHGLRELHKVQYL